jgi:hypothetical protein
LVLDRYRSLYPSGRPTEIEEWYAHVDSEIGRRTRSREELREVSALITQRPRQGESREIGSLDETDAGVGSDERLLSGKDIRPTA